MSAPCAYCGLPLDQHRREEDRIACELQQARFELHPEWLAVSA